MPRILKDFFIYAITFDALAVGATATGNIQIQADADFEVQKLSYFADIAGAAQTVTTQVVPLTTVLIVDAGVNWSGSAAHVAFWLGADENSHVAGRPLCP